VISAGRGIYKVALPETPPGATEVWYRDAEDDFLGVGAGETSEDSTPGRAWFVSVNAAEFARGDPLQGEFFGAIARALGAVNGVIAVRHTDREIWEVKGSPSGLELITAAVGVVDSFAERIRSDLCRRVREQDS